MIKKILEDKDNSLLSRKEVRVIVEFGKNPRVFEMAKVLAEKFQSAEELVAVKGIKGKFGRNTFLVSANIYKTKEEKDLVEPKIKLKAGNAGK